MCQPVDLIVERDMERELDRVSHRTLLRCLSERIADEAFLSVVVRFLNAGAICEGRYEPATDGTPQGSVISPILASMCLHFILDLWNDRRVRGSLKGYTRLIRYADDFVDGLKYEWEAKGFMNALRERLSDQGLWIAKARSQLIEFGRRPWAKGQGLGKRLETFDFLGITHYCDRARAGGFKLGRRTARTRENRALTGINEWLRRVRNLVPLRQWWPIFVAKQQGHYNCYGIGGNLRSLQIVNDRAKWLAYRWINRRSQKRSYDLEQYERWLKYHPLPKPRICHGCPVLVRMQS
jgi:RNA-directed DNA polymerase